MKELKIFTLISFLLVGLSLQAQYDDLYLSSDSEEYLATVEVEEPTYNDHASADDDYEYYTEYDNYYSSRIRRFNRPAGYNYYNSYYSNDLFYDPFSSYYAPSYLRYSRVNRAFIPANRGSVLAITFGNPYTNYGYANRGFRPYGSFGRTGGFGRTGFSSIGGYGCPVGPGIVTSTRVNPVTSVSTRNAYTGARRSTASRTSTRGTSSRVQTYGRSSRTAPTSRATNRRTSTRSSSTRSTSRPTRSNSFKSSSRSSSRTSSRSSSRRR